MDLDWRRHRQLVAFDHGAEMGSHEESNRDKPVFPLLPDDERFPGPADVAFAFPGENNVRRTAGGCLALDFAKLEILHQILPLDAFHRDPVGNHRHHALFQQGLPQGFQWQLEVPARETHGTFDRSRLIEPVGPAHPEFGGRREHAAQREAGRPCAEEMRRHFPDPDLHSGSMP